MMRTGFIYVLLGCLFLFPDLKGQGIEGAITDSNGEPVPFASIYIKELTRGTTSNAMGIFSLPLPPGEYQIYFRSLGYSEVQKKIKVEDTFVKIDIQLPPQTYMIPEVRVSASGEDPAYWIMRKTIGLAHYHLNEVLTYDAEIYIKGTALFNKLPRAIARRIEVNDIKVKENEAYMLESYNEVKYTAPDKYDMTVIASQNTLPGYAESVNPMDYVNASLYQPMIETFISPLARHAFYHYKFKFEGSFLEGAYIIDKIRVTPKRKSQQLCEGYLYIVEDLWCLYSSDLAISTIAGTLYLYQLYANVIMDAWLPVSHKIRMAVQIAGVDADVTYVSSLDYKSVELNPNLPEAYFMPTSDQPEEEQETEPTKEQEKIEELLSQSELSNRDVAKLSKLMEKEAEIGRTDALEEPLNITGTTFTIEEDAVKNDSAFWNKIRPIPLTPEENITLKKRDSVINISKPAAGNDSIPQVRKKSNFAKNLLFGDTKTFGYGKGRYNYGGLIDPEQFNFNTVDGWVYGQYFSMQYKIDSSHTYRLYLKAGYAFNRKAPLISLTTDFLYAPIRRGKIALNLDYKSSDFNTVLGMGNFTNMDYSLFYRQNFMKLYERINAQIYNRIDIVNGLVLETYVDMGLARQLSNTTDFSFFYGNKKDYSINLPDTTLGPENPIFTDRKRFVCEVKLSYTPNNYYVLRNGRKLMRDSKWPTFILDYKQGIPIDNRNWSHFSALAASIEQDSELGLLATIKYKFSGGYFFNSSAMHFSDYKHFKSFPLLFDLIGLENVFTALNYYEPSTNNYWFEAHASLTTPYLLIKLLPWFSERLWTESIGISYLKTPEIGHYTQVGYSMNEILFLMDIGLYVGFEDLSYRGFGVKINFRF